jgi:hypothetical protein
MVASLQPRASLLRNLRDRVAHGRDFVPGQEPAEQDNSRSRLHLGHSRGEKTRAYTVCRALVAEAEELVNAAADPGYHGAVLLALRVGAQTAYWNLAATFGVNSFSSFVAASTCIAGATTKIGNVVFTFSITSVRFVRTTHEPEVIDFTTTTAPMCVTRERILVARDDSLRRLGRRTGRPSDSRWRCFAGRAARRRRSQHNRRRLHLRLRLHLRSPSVLKNPLRRCVKRTGLDKHVSAHTMRRTFNNLARQAADDIAARRSTDMPTARCARCCDRGALGRLGLVRARARGKRQKAKGKKLARPSGFEPETLSLEG